MDISECVCMCVCACVCAVPILQPCNNSWKVAKCMCVFSPQGLRQPAPGLLACSVS